MVRRRKLTGTAVTAFIVIALAFGVTLLWPKDKTADSTAQPTASETAYWSQRATLEAEADAAIRAGQAKSPAPRTEPLTGMNGELDNLPTRPVRLASAPPSGRQMFVGCDAARAAGYENIPAGHPAYHPSMDGDGDGWACEPIPAGRRRR